MWEVTSVLQILSYSVSFHCTVMADQKTKTQKPLIAFSGLPTQHCGAVFRHSLHSSELLSNVGFLSLTEESCFLSGLAEHGWLLVT